MADTYFEVVVKGDGKMLKGFVRGYQVGRSIEGGLWYCADHPIDTKHLREILTLRGNHIHLVCAGTVKTALLAAVKQAKDLRFEVLSTRKIGRVSFEFQVRTYDRDIAAKIGRQLAGLPAGLKCKLLESKETVDKKARGMELYSPVHEYEFRERGKIEGDFETLLAFHETLASIPFTKVEDISIGR